MKKMTKVILVIIFLALVFLAIILLFGKQKDENSIASLFFNTESDLIDNEKLEFADADQINSIRDELQITKEMGERTHFLGWSEKTKWVNKKQDILGYDAWCCLDTDNSKGLVTSIRYFFILNQAGETEFPDLFDFYNRLKTEYGEPTENSLQFTNGLSKADLSQTTFNNPQNSSARYEERWILPDKWTDLIDSVTVENNFRQLQTEAGENTIYEYPGLWVFVWPADKEAGTWLIEMNYQCIIERNGNTGW